MNRLDKETKRHLLIVLGVLILVTIISLIGFIHDGINYQESYNLKLSSGNSHQLIWGSNDDPMPLYPLILHGFNHLVGKISLFWDRILSLSSYLLLIIVAYLIGRIASGQSYVGLISSILVGISPFMIWYANRATVYSLLTLIVATNQLCFIGLYRKRRWAIPGLLITSLLGLALHFFFLAIIIPEIVFLLIKHRDLKRFEYWLALSACVLSAAAFGVWVFYSSKYGINYWRYLPFTAKPSATNTFIIYFQYLFGFQPVVITTLIIALWPLLVILALLAVQKYVRPPVAIQYLFVNSALPILLLFVSSWIWKPLFLSSYLIVCLPSFLIFIGWYLSAFKLRALTIARYSLVAGMLAMMILELSDWHLALQQDYLGTSQQSFNTISLEYKKP